MNKYFIKESYENKAFLYLLSQQYNLKKLGKLHCKIMNFEKNNSIKENKMHTTILVGVCFFAHKMKGENYYG